MNCITCGAAILQSTAEEHGGMCVPCYRKAAAVPPTDFEIPSDIAARIATLNEDPEVYRQMAWSQGDAFVSGYLDEIAKSNELYATWAPKLREFAFDCRAKNPSLRSESLPAREQAKLPIYRTMIQEAERLPGARQNEVIIYSLPLLAISVAQHLWPGSDHKCVLLTPQELANWHEVYDHPEDSFWWFMHYWWNIQDPPNIDAPWESERPLTVPKGAEPWLVVSGICWGSLAGGETTDLWSWNGNAATFVEHISDSQF